ncbi:hypothetical protein L615_000700000440 [Nocardioides sp. J9]|nr:hypothetical protein L615_000700000440 [Nocardioides sp. J9]
MHLDSSSPSAAGTPVRGTASPSHTSAVAVAVLVLVASLVSAVVLIAAAPSPSGSPDADLLSQEIDYGFYGGDAYTGIQNAAADTGNAVVAGGNATLELLTELDEASAERWAHLYRGLAAMLVLAAVANLGRTLQRRS